MTREQNASLRRHKLQRLQEDAMMSGQPQTESRVPRPEASLMAGVRGRRTQPRRESQLALSDQPWAHSRSPRRASGPLTVLGRVPPTPGAACVRLVVLSPPVQPASGPLTRLGDLSRIFIKLVNTTLQLWPCPCCLPSPWVSTSKGPGLVVGAYGEASPC